MTRNEMVRDAEAIIRDNRDHPDLASMIADLMEDAQREGGRWMKQKCVDVSFVLGDEACSGFDVAGELKKIDVEEEE